MVRRRLHALDRRYNGGQMPMLLRRRELLAAMAVLTTLLPTALLQAQNRVPATAQGLETPWDARKIVSMVVEDTTHLKPLIAAMNPPAWVQKGAPGAYILQWQTCQQQLRDVQVVADQLAQKIDSMPKSLDLYFRLEALELTVRSVAEGAQNYGDRSVASQVFQLAGRSFDNRQRLREYLSDLAVSSETNFRIADEEAQRCRGTISREPAASSAKGKSKRN